MLIIIGNSLVNVKLGDKNASFNIITVPIGSFPLGSKARVDIPMAVPMSVAIIVVYGSVKLVLRVDVEGFKMTTVPAESVPEGRGVTVVPAMPVLIPVIAVKRPVKLAVEAPELKWWMTTVQEHSLVSKTD